MALSAFDDKSKIPGEEDLATMLGKTFALWNDLKERISKRFASIQSVWGFTSKNTGWGMRLKQKDRTILYMTPCCGYFLVSFAMGEKAVKAAHGSDLPKSILNVIDSAQKYAEGRGVRFEIRSARNVRHMEMLAIIKLTN